MANFWVICNLCGYSKMIYSESEIYDNDKCPLCEGKMALDMNKGKKVEDEAPGDNFPQIPNREREMRDSIATLGIGHTWYLIEAITEVKLRLQYRALFFKCGGTIPERED